MYHEKLSCVCGCKVNDDESKYFSETNYATSIWKCIFLILYLCIQYDRLQEIDVIIRRGIETI